MLVIAGSNGKILAEQIAKLISSPLYLPRILKFDDNEINLNLDVDLYNKDILIVQSTSYPVNDNLMELLLLINFAKRSGARRVIALVPYLAYSRQDNSSLNSNPLSASLVARLMEDAGVDQVITLDLHSKQVEGFYNVRVSNLDATEIFTSCFQKVDNKIVVSPDLGGLARAQKLARALNCDMAIIDKTRISPGKINIKQILGEVRDKNCIIIDDIIDSAETICKAAILLRDNGAISVSAAATHAIFSKNAQEKIDAVDINEVYVTDTILKKNHSNKIHVVSIAEIISREIIKFI